MTVEDQVLTVEDQVLTVEDQALTVEDQVLTVEDQVLTVEDQVLNKWLKTDKGKSKVPFLRPTDFARGCSTNTIADMQKDTIFTPTSFVPKLFYLKTCINYDKSEFLTNSVKVPKDQNSDKKPFC